MVAVIIYAVLTSKLLDADTRPYVAALAPSDLGANFTLDFKAGDFLTTNIELQNFGKLPADATVKTSITFIPELDLKNAEPLSEPGTIDHIFIWPNPIGATISAKSVSPLSIEDFNFLRSGYGSMYVAAQVQYGKHITRICKQYSMFSQNPRINATYSENSNKTWALVMPVPGLCNYPQSNCVDQECKHAW
jgi:hypothetical protein